MGSVIRPDLPGSPGSDPLDSAVPLVAAAFLPPLVEARWTALGNAGGFSGARLWRGTAGDRALCLKAHPPGTDPVRLRGIHRWMVVARAAGLDFVPAVERTRDGQTVTESAGRAWDLTTWMPGRADFCNNGSDDRLRHAVMALAQLHDAWSGSRTVGPCPAIARRCQALLEWEQLLRAGWRPRFDANDPVRPHAEAAWSLLPAVIDQVTIPLRQAQHLAVALQPCLCDIWHDHVLFEGDRVTGLIDHAAARTDHVAADLARLLGSLIPDDPVRTADALRAYESIRPLPQPELVSLLDRSGLAVSVANWLRWIFHDGRVYPDRSAVANRLGILVRRLIR